jgi:hypothetical protein
MSTKRRTLKPSQIATLLQYLTGIPIDGLTIACWRMEQQAQSESWCDWEIHRLIICDIDRTPVGGRARCLPHRAIEYLSIQSLRTNKGTEWQRYQKMRVEAERIRIHGQMERRRQA